MKKKVLKIAEKYSTEFQISFLQIWAYFSPQQQENLFGVSQRLKMAYNTALPSMNEEAVST